MHHVNSTECGSAVTLSCNRGKTGSSAKCLCHDPNRAARERDRLEVELTFKV